MISCIPLPKGDEVRSKPNPVTTPARISMLHPRTDSNCLLFHDFVFCVQNENRASCHKKLTFDDMKALLIFAGC
jgi:hypothetical protein